MTKHSIKGHKVRARSNLCPWNYSSAKTYKQEDKEPVYQAVNQQEKNANTKSARSERAKPEHNQKTN